MDGKPPLTPATGEDTAFFGHPRGLATLFFTEMWERFSYYGMRAFLIFYFTRGEFVEGLGMARGQAGLILGIYIGMVYLLSLPGGWIADRFLGQQKAVFYGGIAIMCGHICLAVPITGMFPLGLTIICIGTGLLKPNVSTIVGQLYTPEDKRRDSGFSLYYMGINLGAFLGPLVCGFLVDSRTFPTWLASMGIERHNSWHFGFAAAAVGMFFGLVQYSRGTRYLREAGLRPVPPASPEEARKNKRILIAIIATLLGIPALIAVTIATKLVVFTEDGVTYGVLALLMLVSAGLFVAMFARAERGDRNRIIGLLVLFFGAAVFFFVFEQASSTFNLFARDHTDNSILGISFPATFWQSVNSVFIIVFAPVFAGIWLWLAKRNQNPAWPLKFGIAMVLLALGCLVMVPAATIGDAGGKAGPIYLCVLYLLHTWAELCLSPVGLSATTKIAPSRIAGLAMGIWFAGTAVGNYMAGVAAGWGEKLSLPMLFVAIAIPPLLAAGVFFGLVRPLQRMVGERSLLSTARPVNES